MERRGFRFWVFISLPLHILTHEEEEEKSRLQQEKLPFFFLHWLKVPNSLADAEMGTKILLFVPTFLRMGAESACGAENSRLPLGSWVAAGRLVIRLGLKM